MYRVPPVEGHNPELQTRLRQIRIDNALATIFFGKKFDQLSKDEQWKVDQARAELTNAEKERLPNMPKDELDQFARDNAVRFEQKWSIFKEGPMRGRRAA